MENYLVIITVGLGTYLTRFIPIRFSERFRKLKNIDEFLKHSSTALISALFITSFLSSPTDLGTISKGTVALIAVFISYKLWRNLGVSILVGVVSHFLVNLIMKLT